MQRIVFACLILLTTTIPVYAQEENVPFIDNYTEITIEQNNEPSTNSEDYKNQPIIQTEENTTPHPLSKPYRSTDILPLFAKQLGLSEEKTPPPFTLMILGNYLQTNIETWNFTGNIKILNNPLINILFPNGIPIGSGTGIDANITEVTQRFFTGGIRFVVNILPFWNVYGIFAQSTGTTISGIQVGGTAPIAFTMAFDATSFGFGTSLAIGGELFFTAIDVNYVVTMVESIKNMIYTVNASARFGIHQRYGDHLFAMWVGGNYMENTGGSNKLGAVISVERLGDLINLPLGGLLNSPANIIWAVNQRPKNLFSATIGMRYSPNRNFDIITEIGFIDRVNVMISAAFNF